VKRLWVLPVLLLSGAVRVCGAETPQEQLERLQRSIEGASELGRVDRVKVLRLELAETLDHLSDYAGAARQYELVLASRPLKRERVKLFVKLGRMRSAMQNYSGAIGAFQDARHDDPKDWDANLELARAYAHADLDTLAVGVYQRCIALRPKNHQPYGEIGDVYQRLGYLHKAIEAYQKALQIEPKPETYLSMADCYVRQGDMVNATAVLQQAKTSLPRADYDVRLGDIYRKQEDFNQAVKAWEEALKADRKRDDVRLKLFLAYHQLNRPQETDHMMKQLVAGYPESPLVHFVKAWVLFDRGDRSGARREAMVVQGLVPTDLVRHYNERLLVLLNK
jgi:tetratricopeptide (TPR) repeat protein